MKYVWEDLPERKNCFTVRNATLVDLDTGEIIQYYLANTKIAVVQKFSIPGKTYYRTADAACRSLNHAFEASAFGLPNELAPSVPSQSQKKPVSLAGKSISKKPVSNTIPAKETNIKPIIVLPKDGEEQRRGFFSRLFRRKYGKSKNS